MAALTRRQHRKSKRRGNGRTAQKVSAPKRLGSKTLARARCARRKTPEWWPAFRASLRPGLERDTQLMPWLIADSVCGEVSGFLGVEIPARYSDWLDAKAERCYANHRHFRKLMRGRGNGPRDWLYVFMRHWLAAMLDLERPDLYQCLPEDFNLGHPGRPRPLPESPPGRRGLIGIHPTAPARLPLAGAFCLWGPQPGRCHACHWEAPLSPPAAPGAAGSPGVTNCPRPPCHKRFSEPKAFQWRLTAD